MTSAMKSTLRPSLRVVVTEREEISVVTLTGRLDQTFEDRLSGAFDRLLEQKRVRVIVDLRGLDFLNSRGVSAFIAAVDDLREAGGDLKLTRVPVQARIVLERLGVDRLLQQFGTLDEAADAFQVPIGEFLTSDLLT